MGWFDTLSENLVRQTTNTFLNVANTVAFDSAMSQNCSNVVSQQHYLVGKYKT